MKMLLTAVALAALIASPAVAKTARHHQASGAFASVQEPGNVRAPNDVYVGTRVIGADPDPAVRLELIRGKIYN